ncbi:hypothetical protein SUGI_1009740 [Cryptomeria japonica]|uniref:probable 2-oxoglutarate-dependent dioxygenase AOP1 n=1 Tax=Cryptomeria japonica TaxID=3369 RepID=UPI0024148C70|nr:probable 2-oxoglutarate-dependent dioxygenase AOP1 [Cryptomeria japonica]GLJ47809.1 hypothetical protein SUGI_1009740 [Cryptomeria japonica]
MSCEIKDLEQIPVIDLSSLNHCLHDDDTERAYAEVRRACEDWGCFLVKNHGIKEKLIHQMDSVARQIFTLPSETKQKHSSEGWNISYMADLAGLPFYESIGVPGAPDPTAIKKFSDHLWPQGNPQICKVIEDYTCGVEELTINIIKAILRSYGVSKYYSSFQFEGHLRMNYCNSSPNEKGGCTTHTDQNCIVVMYEDNMGGLEVKSKAGKWVDVKPLDNSLMVFMGDSFTAWSNGRIHNVTHRVVFEGYSRVSVPFFYFFSDKTLIHAPPELVDNDHPRLYKPFVYADYRDYWQPKKQLRVMSRQSFLAESEETFLENFAGISKA